MAEIINPTESFVGNSTPNVDLIVFVHGLKGDFQSTWGQFPNLLRSDPALPVVDILLWGFRSSLTEGFWARILKKIADIESLGDQLFSKLDVMTKDHRSIFLVGHSMGGLILLSGLVRRFEGGYAQEDSAGKIQHIALFATPVLGSELANVAGKLPCLSAVRSSQVKNLAKGPFVEALHSRVNSSIYNPRTKTGTDAYRRRVPIRVIRGARDLLVAPTAAAGVFSDPTPLDLDYGHSSVKLPTTITDDRYLALRGDLLGHWQANFRATCRACGGNDSEAHSAQRVFRAKWQPVLIREVRSRTNSWPAAAMEALVTESVQAVWKEGSTSDAQPIDVIRETVQELIDRRVAPGAGS